MEYTELWVSGGKFILRERQVLEGKKGSSGAPGRCYTEEYHEQYPARCVLMITMRRKVSGLSLDPQVPKSTRCNRIFRCSRSPNKQMWSSWHSGLVHGSRKLHDQERWNPWVSAEGGVVGWLHILQGLRRINKVNSAEHELKKPSQDKGPTSSSRPQ